MGINWFNALTQIITTLGLAGLGVFGFNTAWRAYLDWRLRLAETYNAHAKTVITLIEKNEEKHQALKREIEELEDECKKGDAAIHAKCESINNSFASFRQDTLEMIKIAMKIK